LGRFDPSTIGFTLAHEHIYIKLGYNAEPYDYVDQIDDDDVLADELLAFKSSGGTAIVEATA
jgi:predicted metal-dependent phosphotriesterase family hydrolase